MSWDPNPFEDGFKIGYHKAMIDHIDPPEDIRECCEVLRDSALWEDGAEVITDDFYDVLEAATWQLLEYLGVL